jgi:hypothetical protein
VATAADVISAPAQEPPLVVTPPPGDEETPDEDEIPDEEDEPVDDEPPEPEEPDEDPLSNDRCGITAAMCPNLAPTTAAAAADSRPTRQVIRLTRRSPLSRAWSAAVI